MEAFENGCFEPIPALEKAEKAREKGKAVFIFLKL